MTKATATSKSAEPKRRPHCAVCDKRIGKGKLMCLGHWQLVPIRLAVDLTRALRAYRNATVRPQRVLHLKAYLHARQAAIAAVLMVTRATAAQPDHELTSQEQLT